MPVFFVVGVALVGAVIVVGHMWRVSLCSERGLKFEIVKKSYAKFVFDYTYEPIWCTSSKGKSAGTTLCRGRISMTHAEGVTSVCLGESGIGCWNVW